MGSHFEGRVLLAEEKRKRNDSGLMKAAVDTVHSTDKQNRVVAAPRPHLTFSHHLDSSLPPACAEIKTNIKYVYFMAIIKKSTREGVEKREPSCTVGGNVS